MLINVMLGLYGAVAVYMAILAYEPSHGKHRSCARKPVNSLEKVHAASIGVRTDATNNAVTSESIRARRVARFHRTSVYGTAKMYQTTEVNNIATQIAHPRTRRNPRHPRHRRIVRPPTPAQRDGA